MHGVIFYSVNLRINTFQHTFLYRIEDIDSLKTMLNIFFTSDFFAKLWEFTSCQFGHALSQFIKRALKILFIMLKAKQEIVYELSRTTKSFRIDLWSYRLIGRINFVPYYHNGFLILSKNYSFSIFAFQF